MSSVTFIVPSLNRPTLQRTLRSLLNQTDTNWKAIVMFDGVEVEYSALPDDARITYIRAVEKLGRLGGFKVHSSAGAVRNYAMSFVLDEDNDAWFAFVDDDDIVVPHYVEILRHTIREDPSAECVIFRMRLPDKKVLPPPDAVDIEPCKVGISFAYRKALYDDGFIFQADEWEDFHLLNSMRAAGKRMLLSPFVTYLASVNTEEFPTAS